MATQLQLRRGNTTAQNAFTGAEGEVTMDTTTNQLRVHDGSTQGGHVIGASATQLNNYMTVANTQALFSGLVANVVSTANLTVEVAGYMTVANTQALHTSITANLNSYIANSEPRFTTLTTNVNDRMQVANTNTLVNDRMQVANTNTLVNDRMQVANTNTLVNDRMQVANTVTLANARLGAGATVALTGDVTASATAFSTNAVSVATTIANDSVDGNKLTDNITLAGDLTVGGGDITLSGTGRIQGVDTVSAATDAASKTYVDTAVANIVDSAPAALDTLNELAAALGDDASFSTTVATNIGQKLGATASVTLTGDVTGTASFSANAVSIATTYNNDVVLGTDTSGNYVASLTAGALIDVGGAGEGATPTVAVDLSELTTSTSNGDGDFFAVVDSSNAQKKLTKANINISGFNNDANFSTTTGTVTSHTVSAGNGLTGGGTVTSSGTSTLNVGAGTGISVAADTVGLAADQRHGASTDVYVGNGHEFIHFDDGNQLMRFYVANGEDMRLESDGDLQVDGDVVSESTAISSDEKLKENIEVVENAVEKIHQLRGVEFSWKKNGHKSAGVIAQDVEKVLPQAVKEVKSLADGEDPYLTVKYDSLHALTIEAIKTMSNEIAALKEEIRILKGE